MSIDDPQRDAGLYLDSIFNPMILEMRSSPVPIITAVRGAAVGVGCGIALAGDMIVAGENAYFFQAFSKVGLSPNGGSSYLLVKAIGRARATEMMLMGANSMQCRHWNGGWSIASSPTMRSMMPHLNNNWRPNDVRSAMPAVPKISSRA